MGRMRGVLSRIRELKRKITYAENKRGEFLHYAENLKEHHKRGNISYSDFLENFYKKIGGKNINEWIDHLDFYILECKREINRERINLFLFWLF